MTSRIIVFTPFFYLFFLRILHKTHIKNHEVYNIRF